MSKAAIGFSIRKCIVEAYQTSNLKVPQGITAYSTRCAVTNTVFDQFVSVEEICKVETWSSISTFINHYKINAYDSSDAASKRRLLQ